MNDALFKARVEAYGKFISVYYGRLFDKRKRKSGQIFPDEYKGLLEARSAIVAVGSGAVINAIMDWNEISKRTFEESKEKGEEKTDATMALMKVFVNMRIDLGCEDLTENDLLPYFLGG